MALDFPGSPTGGQVYPAPNGVTYVYDSDSGLWRTQGGNGENTVFISATAPVAPTNGKMWWNSVTGTMFVWYEDGDSAQWVPATTQAPAVIAPGQSISANDLTVSGDLTTANINGTGITNLIRNPAFRFWERGSGPTAVSAGTSDSYLADGWTVRGTAGTGGSATQQLVTDGNVNKHRLITSGYGGQGILYQYLEAADLWAYSGKEMCISVHANYLPSTSVILYDRGGNGVSIISSVTMTRVGTTDRYYATFTIPPNTEIGTSAVSKGMDIQILYADGASPLPDATYDTWDVQLETGSSPMPFTPPVLSEDLARCQRYFQRTGATHVIYVGSVSTGNTYSVTSVLPVIMRSSPTINNVSSGGRSGFDAPELNVANSRSVTFKANASSTKTNAYFWVGYDAIAEL